VSRPRSICIRSIPLTVEESVLVRASDLVPDAASDDDDSRMTEEERKLRERKRLRSKGLIAFQPSGARPHETATLPTTGQSGSEGQVGTAATATTSHGSIGGDDGRCSGY
jgi:hypothetical protein